MQKYNWKSYIYEYIDYIIVVVFIGAISIWNLSDPVVFLWDESPYAARVKLILDGYIWPVHSHTSKYGGMQCGEPLCPWMEKPPLGLWLSAASVFTFGWLDYELALRLPSAGTFVLTALTVYEWGRRAISRRAGLFSSLALTVVPPLTWHTRWLHNARTADLDMGLVFFGTLFLFAVWVAVVQDRDRAFLVAGASLGFAFLFKGVAAFMFGLVALPFFVRPRAFWTRYFAAGAAIAISLIGIWPLAMYLRLGESFVGVFLIEQLVNRSASASTVGDPLLSTSNYPYLKRLPEYWDVFSVPLAAATVWGVLRAGTRRDWTIGYWVLWLATIPLAYSLVGGTYAHYLHPMVPAGALLLGGAASGAFDTMAVHFTRVKENRNAVVLVAVACCLALSIAVLPLPTTSDRTSAAQFELANDVPEEDGVIAVQNDLSRPFRFTLIFQTYTSQRVVYVPPDQISQQGCWAVATDRTLSNATREYRTLDRYQSVSSVQFTDC